MVGTKPNMVLLAHILLPLISSRFPFQLLPWPVLAIFRGIVALYCIGWIIYSGFYPYNGQEKWFIYLTNWGFTLITLYFILSFAVTLCYHLKEKQQYPMRPPMELTNYGTSFSDQPMEEGTEGDFNVEVPLKGHHKAMWIIYETGASVAVVITLLYWSLLSGGNLTGVYLGLDITTHALNSFFLLIEVAITSLPIRVLHVIYPVCFAFIYMIFTVIYWAGEGTDAIYNKRFVYPILDYSNSPGLAVGLFLGAALVAVPLVHVCIFYGLYRLREFVVTKRRRDRVNTV